VTKEVRLGRSSMVALVDDADFDLVSQSRWQVDRNRYTYYAYRPRLVGWPTMMHGLIMGALGIDHADGNGLNNQRANLRLATGQQNNANRRKRPGTTASIYKGVSRHNGRIAKPWIAYIGLNNRTVYLGCFAVEEDAARAYDAAAVEHFGEFALLNLPAEVSR
jgi:hypothetical protein